MQIISFISYKGGSGKTTAAAVLAQAAAHDKKKVCVIDLDAQRNLSFALGAQLNTRNTSYKLITGQAQIEDLAQRVNNISVIPGGADLAALTTEKGSARRLQDAIKRSKTKFDYIFIDTPPGAGELQYNAMQAATGVIIPLQADIYNLQAFYQVCGTVDQIKKSNANLAILGVILSMYDGRSNLSKQMRDAIQNAAQNYNVPFLGIVSKSIKVSEAAALQQSLFEYAPKSRPAQDYWTIYKQL